MRQRQGPDSAAAHGKRVQWRQVERPPHFDDSPVAGSHQIFAVSRQQDALDGHAKSIPIISMMFVQGPPNVVLALINNASPQR